MSKMFGKEAVSQMMKGGGLQSMPGHPVKPGDSWPFSTTVELPQIGKVSMKGAYTLKSIGDHDESSARRSLRMARFRWI